MTAAYAGQKDAVEVLLNAGADPNLVADNGKTAVRLAGKHEDVQRLISGSKFAVDGFWGRGVLVGVVAVVVVVFFCLFFFLFFSHSVTLALLPVSCSPPSTAQSISFTRRRRRAGHSRPREADGRARAGAGAESPSTPVASRITTGAATA